MNSIKYCIVTCILLLFISTGCKDRDEYRVDDAFAIYVQRFEDEGSKRGRTFNLQSSGLIVEFADLKNNTAGLCHYENPIRIEIDRTYWKDISNNPGADLMKENLIFHELGHGLLGRRHLNTTLENGDWKSIMCGGDKVDNRPWNINYRGERHEYYLDELFNESTTAPNFSSNQLLQDTTGYSPQVMLSFDTPSAKDTGWPITSNEQYTTSIDNQRLRFESKIDQSYLVMAKTSVDVRGDFVFQFTIEYPIGNLNDQYGLVFGSISDESTGNADPIEYFSINNNRRMYMGNRSWYSFHTELTKPEILPNGKNKLKVLKTGDMLYYFINDVYSYRSEAEISGGGYHFGFMVPTKGVIYLDNFFISAKNAAGVKSELKSGTVKQFEIVTVEFSEQNVIRGK